MLDEKTRCDIKPETSDMYMAAAVWRVYIYISAYMLMG